VSCRSSHETRCPLPRINLKEIFAHLIVHHATRDLLVEASRIAQCPAERTSFTRALHVVRRSVIAPTGFSPLSTQT